MSVTASSPHLSCYSAVNSWASCLDLPIRTCEVLQTPDSYAMAAALPRKRVISVEMPRDAIPGVCL